MSVMIALRRSEGSISPLAVPMIFSYCPTAPKDWPLYVGDSRLRTVSFVTFELAGEPATLSPNTSAAIALRRRYGCIDMV